MPATYNILIMGASYGSLLASKLLFGGHQVKLVCLPAEADLINAEGFRVRLPVIVLGDAASWRDIAPSTRVRAFGLCRDACRLPPDPQPVADERDRDAAGHGLERGRAARG